MIKQYIKFEVSTFTCSVDMKGNTKCRNWGKFGWLGVTKGHLQQNYSIEGMHLPIQL